MELEIVKRDVFNSNVQEVQTKYVLAIPRYEAWDMETVSGLIAERTTLAAAEVEFGAGMELGALGKVEPSLSSVAVDTKEQISLKNIRKVNLIYKPSKRIKRKLKDLKFEINRRTPYSESSNRECDGEE